MKITKHNVLTMEKLKIMWDSMASDKPPKAIWLKLPVCKIKNCKTKKLHLHK